MNEINNNIFNDDERQYLLMMQSNIERMASNSSNSKAWLSTIIAGMMALTGGFDQLHWWFLLSLLPIGIFWYLDGYYLSLERGMRNRERFYLNKRNAHNGVCSDLLFDFKPLETNKDDEDAGYVRTKWQWFTPSVMPFYAIISVVVIVVSLILNLA